MLFRRYNPIRGPRLTLLCLPYAGGGISVFQGWHRHMAPGIEVCTVELPGRDSLIGTRPHTDFGDLIDQLETCVSDAIGPRFALFGHSIGALMVFELARRLRDRRSVQPEVIFVSGHGAPDAGPGRQPPAHGTDTEVDQELRGLERTPHAVLENEELMQLFRPLLRADFRLYNSYQYRDSAPLDIPIVVLGGHNDAEVDRDALGAWSRHTTSGCAVRLFEGGHFFIEEQRGPVLAVINDVLAHLPRKGRESHRGNRAF